MILLKNKKGLSIGKLFLNEEILPIRLTNQKISGILVSGYKKGEAGEYRRNGKRIRKL